MPPKSSSLKTILIFIVLVTVVGSLIYWLWQRQPKSLVSNNDMLSPQSQNQSATSSATQAQKITIDTNKVLSQNKFQLQGQTQPNSIVIIYSNSQNAVTKSDASGKFSQSLNLDDGLNLIGLSTLGQDLKEIAATNLTYYVGGAKIDDTIVYAGLVKSIFKDTITLTTQTGEATVKQLQNAKISIPKLPGVSAQTQDQDIRVGDYMISLGKNLSEGQLQADNISILRDDKPQNPEHWAIVKVLTTLTKNSFQAEQNGQSNTVKIATDINTSYLDKDQKADSKAVVKDRSAIVIYHADDKGNDLADLIDLLP